MIYHPKNRLPVDAMQYRTNGVINNSEEILKWSGCSRATSEKGTFYMHCPKTNKVYRVYSGSYIIKEENGFKFKELEIFEKEYEVNISY